MTMPAVYFSHGQESGPWGSKITAMAAAVRAQGCRAESVDYRDLPDPADRIERLIAECRGVAGPLVLVGSSMGGLVATAAAAATGAAGLFVLAPAYYIDELEHLMPRAPEIPLEIVHGWGDDVVPVDASIRYARECRATLHVVDGDHRLTANIDRINAWLLDFVRRIGKGENA